MQLCVHYCSSIMHRFWLQRIALAYMVVALCEIWAPRRRQDVSNDNFAIFKTYHFHW